MLKYVFFFLNQKYSYSKIIFVASPIALYLKYCATHRNYIIHTYCHSVNGSEYLQYFQYPCDEPTESVPNVIAVAVNYFCNTGKCPCSMLSSVALLMRYRCSPRCANAVANKNYIVLPNVPQILIYSQRAKR